MRISFENVLISLDFDCDELVSTESFCYYSVFVLSYYFFMAIIHVHVFHMFSPKSIVAIDIGSSHHHIVVGEANVLNHGQFVPKSLTLDCNKNDYKYGLFSSQIIHRLVFASNAAKMYISSHCTSYVPLLFFFVIYRAYH